MRSCASNRKPESRASLLSLLLSRPPIGAVMALGLALLFSLPFARAAEGAPVIRHSRILMGTSVEITVSQAGPGEAEEALEAAFREIERINLLMSLYLPESEISRVNRDAGKKAVRVSPEILEVIEGALHFSRLSGGALDITVGPVFRLWDFRRGRVPDPAGLRENLKRVDYRKVRVDRAGSAVSLEDPGMEIDLGAIAKGYAADRAGQVLEKKGIGNFLVNAGGDLKVRGKREPEVPWVVGIRHPRLSPGLLARIQPGDAAVATSGDYEKYFLRDGERYHHLLDPSTGRPARGCQSATVLAPSAMDADALATAVFVLGPEKGFALIEKMPRVRALVVDRRGAVRSSPGWPPGVLLPP